MEVSMKTTFFCVRAEFYRDGSRKYAITERACKEKPRNRMRALPFMSAYMDWFDDLGAAQAFLAERRMSHGS
jgi:hypothetical protein